MSETDLGWGNSDGDYEQSGGEGRAGGVLCNRANRQRVSPIPLIKSGRRERGREEGRAICSCCPVLHRKNDVTGFRAERETNLPPIFSFKMYCLTYCWHSALELLKSTSAEYLISVATHKHTHTLYTF